MTNLKKIISKGIVCITAMLVVVGGLTLKLSAEDKAQIYSNSSNVKTKFKKGKAYFAYNEGGEGFYITNMKGSKMTFRLHIPSFEREEKNKSAIISNDGKIAKSKFKCKSGKIHYMTITYIDKHSVKIRETTNCTEMFTPTTKKCTKKSFTRMYHDEAYWADYMANFENN